MLLQQIKYCLKSRKFKIIIVIAFLILFTTSFFQNADVFLMDYNATDISNPSAFKKSLFNELLNKYNIWINAIPDYCQFILIIIGIPFSMSYLQEKESGLLNFIDMRVSHKKYVLSKFFANFIIGGLTVVIPFLIFTMVLFIFFGGSIDNATLVDRFGGAYNHLFRSNFYLYLLFHCSIFFLIGGVYANICLAVSTFTKNRIAITLAPFIFYVFTAITFYNLGQGIYKFAPETIHQFFARPDISIFEILINLITIFSICFFIYLKRSSKEFVYDRNNIK